jgi:cytochrome P450
VAGLDLMFPAATTVSTTLNFTMAFLLNNPKVQTKVQEELDAVVGRDRLPTLNDRARSVETSVPIKNIVRNRAVPT